MRQIIGILKFGAALTIATGCVVSFTIVLRKYDPVVSILAIILVGSIYGLYTYYLIHTGLKNLKKKVYLINAWLIIGLFLHFVFLLVTLYYCTIYPEMAITTIPFAIAGLAIGCYDLKQFFQTWKSNRIKIP